ncbi:hypothetical protein NDN16_15430 [Aureimonas altamirensis]|nr:hypothetical protein [Aureimonas altamirensis]
MKNPSDQRLLAEKLFMPIVSSGGASSITALTAISTTKAKSARLRALRLARDAEQRLPLEHPS